MVQTVQMCCSAFFLLLRPADPREGGPSRACSTAVVIPGKKKREVAAVSLQFITSEILAIFTSLESSFPALLYHVRLKRVFFPLISFWNGLIIIGKMVIVAGSLSSFWEVKLGFLWFLAGICPAFFPKTFYIQAGPISLLPFSYHTIYFLNRLHDKTAFLKPCHNMIQNGCSKAYVAFYFF